MELVKTLVLKTRKIQPFKIKNKRHGIVSFIFKFAMKALYIVGDKIFILSKRLCVKRNIHIFYVKTMGFTKVFQDNMLPTFRIQIRFRAEGKESKSRQRLTMKIAIDTMRMYIFSYIRYTLLKKRSNIRSKT